VLGGRRRVPAAAQQTASTKRARLLPFAEGYGFFIKLEYGYILFAAVCVRDDLPPTVANAAFSSLFVKSFFESPLFCWECHNSRTVPTSKRSSQPPPAAASQLGAQAACHNEETRCWCCCCCCCRRRHPSATFGQTLYPFACAAAALCLNMVSL
jgi:hypothetical protein